jgi:hypothetical protein
VAVFDSSRVEQTAFHGLCDITGLQTLRGAVPIDTRIVVRYSVDVTRADLSGHYGYYIVTTGDL